MFKIDKYLLFTENFVFSYTGNQVKRKFIFLRVWNSVKKSFAMGSKLFLEKWFFFLFPGEFFLKIKFNSFFFAICETQWKRNFRIFFFTLKTKFLRGKIKSPERKGKRMFSNAWKRMKKNLEKIICETEWNRRFEGSHIFPGNCIFLSHVWKQMKKKNPYKVSPERKKVLAGNPNFTRNCFFFQTKFSFVFFLCETE